VVTTVYLVRHAEAEGNAKEFFQGNIDTLLTEKGLKQLDFLADRFRDIPLDAIYTSPYARARQTAEAVNRYHRLTLIPDERLREINAGDWERRKWADLPTLFPAEYALWTQKMYDFIAPNGDRMTDVYTRMRDTVTEIAQANPGKTIAVASHGCALRNFLCYVEFGDIKRLKDVGWADNTAVSLAEFDPERGWHLVYKNHADHLPPEYSTLRTSKWSQYDRKNNDILPSIAK